MARMVTGIVGPKTSSTGTKCKMKTPPNKFEGLVISASGKIPDYEHGKPDSVALAYFGGY